MAVAGSRYGGRWTTYLHTVTAAESAAKKFSLITQPKVPSTLLIDLLDGGGTAVSGVHFALNGQEIQWNSYELDGALSENDRIRVTYL